MNIKHTVKSIFINMTVGYSVDVHQGDFQTFPTALRDPPDDKFEQLFHYEEDQQQKKEESSVHEQWSS